VYVSNSTEGEDGMTDRSAFVNESIDLLYRYKMKMYQQKAEKHGVTVPQARVIAEVFKHKTTTIKDLTYQLKMTQSTVSDVVERLVKKDFLVKKPSNTDKRSVDISLSEELSKQIDEHLPKIAHESFAEVLDRLSPDEQKRVEDGMKLLISALKQGAEEGETGDEEFFHTWLCSYSGSKQP